MNPNKKILSRQSSIDTVGILASSICAIHCLLLPMILSMSAFGGFVFLNNPVLENIFLATSAFVAIGSLLTSYIRHHRKFTAIGILLFGFLFIGLSRFVAGFNESLLTSSGAAMVALAHYVNFRLCKNVHQHP